MPTEPQTRSAMQEIEAFPSQLPRSVAAAAIKLLYDQYRTIRVAQRSFGDAAEQQPA
jgi:hypothetical protein